MNTAEGAQTGPPRTSDGHHIVVNGRKWRATDPGIPDNFRQELVNELTTARRLVKTDPETARRRVSDAKHALGERGYEWWGTPTNQELATRIDATIRALLSHRDGASICPSDVARTLGGGTWRDLMSTVRERAYALKTEGQVEVTQGGKPVDADARGPIRIVRRE